ncbi:hypothetical protein ACFOG5_08890 [Pedobacter fastidiosus]|uniref:Lipocalin-like domain-containing protein n=1 Tax=Pedobacter fastidiosus TaxID=2765361 RepID=A0ABR7KTF1_9SPHI|nr:hypothetical protein [Pedobacter fastidiosus]MBC6111325.1 hypothetical protein [Pedobacter fastidiosus]
MKKIRITLITLVTVLGLVSCKKDSVEKTTSEKIQAKWSITSSVNIEDVPPAPKATFTEKGAAGDYVDFRTDGKVYSKQGSSAEEVSPYTIVNDSQVNIDGEIYTIDQLTDNVLVLHSKQVFSTGGYTEDIVNLYK